MNKYLMEITKRFGEKMVFTVEAVTEQDALERAKTYVNFSHRFDDCNKYNIKVVKRSQSKQSGFQWSV